MNCQLRRSQGRVFLFSFLVRPFSFLSLSLFPLIFSQKKKSEQINFCFLLLLLALRLFSPASQETRITSLSATEGGRAREREKPPLLLSFDLLEKTKDARRRRRLLVETAAAFPHRAPFARFSELAQASRDSSQIDSLRESVCKALVVVGRERRQQRERCRLFFVVGVGVVGVVVCFFSSSCRPAQPQQPLRGNKDPSPAPTDNPSQTARHAPFPALPGLGRLGPGADEEAPPVRLYLALLDEARYLALLDEALARRDGCFAHVVAEPLSSLRASSNYYDVTEEYTRFQSDSSSSSSSSSSTPPPPLVVGSYVLRLATLARIVDVRRPPASSRAPGALVTIRGEARLALLSLEDDVPYLRIRVEACPDAVPTAEAVCGESGEGCQLDDEGEESNAGLEREDADAVADAGADDEEEEALVAAVLARGAQEVEALLWDVVNLSYKLPRPNAAGSQGSSGSGSSSSSRKARRNNGIRISGAGRRFGGDDQEDDDDEEDDEEEEPLLPDLTGTIASLQAALNWAGDVPGLAPLSLSSSASSVSSSSSSPTSSSAPSSSLSPLAAAAERGARLGFAALQQVPHAGSAESLRELAAARAAAMETGDTAERLRLAADFLRKSRAELAAKAALKALLLG